MKASEKIQRRLDVTGVWRWDARQGTILCNAVPPSGAPTTVVALDMYRDLVAAIKRRETLDDVIKSMEDFLAQQDVVAPATDTSAAMRDMQEEINYLQDQNKMLIDRLEGPLV